MATAWDTTLYTLTDQTSFKYVGNTKVDMMADGSVRIRQISTQIPVEVYVALAPLSSAASSTFESYMRTNAMTEWALPNNSKTYTGYVKDGSLAAKVSDGDLYWWTFTLLALMT